MSSLEDRREAFEKKFAHDENLRFRVEARACRLFGIWMADQLGLIGGAVESYVKDVIGSNLEEKGFNDVKRKVKADMKEKDIAISDHRLDRELEHCMEEAKKQILAE
jgi:hypothetical protein